MPHNKSGELSPKEHAFADYYFETRNPGLSAINAGYPANSASKQAYQVLQRPHVKAHLRKLWEASESPIVMGVRERKEKLSMIARGMVGNCLDEKGEVDLKVVREMPAVREIVITDWRSPHREGAEGMESRTVKIKLLNPVESIAELNKMEQLYRITEGPVNINPVYNYYITDPSVKGKMERIGERTQKTIEITGGAVEGEDTTG